MERMTMKEITKWCYDHVTMKSRCLFNDEGHHKVRFENGDTYEWKSVNDGYCRDRVSIRLNGEMVAHFISRECWLPNGVYGRETIEELPLMA